MVPGYIVDTCAHQAAGTAQADTERQDMAWQEQIVEAAAAAVVVVVDNTSAAAAAAAAAVAQVTKMDCKSQLASAAASTDT